MNPSYSMDEESGEYMRVYMGYSIFGKRSVPPTFGCPGISEGVGVHEGGRGGRDEDYVAALIRKRRGIWTMTETRKRRRVKTAGGIL